MAQFCHSEVFLNSPSNCFSPVSVPVLGKSPWKYLRLMTNLSWCLSSLTIASYILLQTIEQLFATTTKMPPVWTLVIPVLFIRTDFSYYCLATSNASVNWAESHLCLYVNTQAFVNIQRHTVAPHLIQNVWPGLLSISQRSKNLNFWITSIMLFAALAADFLLAHCPSSSFRHLVCPLLSRDWACFLTQLLCSLAG